LDTNVIVSALAHYSSSTKESADVQVFRMWTTKNVMVIVSEEILEEYKKLLERKQDEIQHKRIAFNWLKLLDKYAYRVTPTIKIDVIKEDPDDNKFIERATTGKAKYIVSRDKHLLKLRLYKGVEVLTPNEFLKKIADQVCSPVF